MAQKTGVRASVAPGGMVKNWGLSSSKGGFKSCVFVARHRYVPPLRRGLKGIASTLGRCDNSAEDSRPGTAHQAVVTRGYPPAPPSQGGDDAQRNPDEDKACARRTFHHPNRPVSDRAYPTNPHGFQECPVGVLIPPDLVDSKGRSGGPVRRA